MIFRLIDKYVLKTLIPYFIFALSFLTGILLLQQLSRLSSIHPSGFLSSSSTLLILYALLPKTLAFTLPMSTLIAVLLGISKLRSDSEILILSSSGVSNLRLLKPIAVFALGVSISCAYLNLYLSPNALSWLREIAKSVTQEDIASAISIGTFNNQLKNLNIYVKEGNSAKGEWRGLFIIKNENNLQRVITAKSGTLDFDGKRVELVLKDVTSIRFPYEKKPDKETSIVVEKLQFLRFEIADNVNFNEREENRVDNVNFEETGSMDLLNAANNNSPASIETAIQLQRRTALSFSPIVLALLGFFAGSSLGRGGKTFGLILSLFLLLSYYLVFLTGEQLSRMGLLPVFVGGWLANFALPLGIFVFTQMSVKTYLYNVYAVLARYIFMSEKRRSDIYVYISTKIGKKHSTITKESFSSGFVPLGYMDRSILTRVCFFFLLTYLTFVSLFIIFTFFELWKSIFSNNVPMGVVTKYLIYLLPLVTVQVVGPCMLVAVFAAFLLTVNRNEVVIWLSSGIGVYRLILPVLLASFVIVSLHWWIQERIMPQANVAQDSLRSFIKTGFPRTFAQEGRQWFAFNDFILNYEFDVAGSKLIKPYIYVLDESYIIKKVIRADEAIWLDDKNIRLEGYVEIDAVTGSSILLDKGVTLEKELPIAYFNTFLSRPFYLTAAELKEYIEIAEIRGEDTRQLSIAYHRRFSDPFSVVVFSLFGVCTALLFSRSKAFLQVLVAVASGISILVLTQFVTNAGVQLGLPIVVACWLPYLLFAAIGTYLIAILKT